MMTDEEFDSWLSTRLKDMSRQRDGEHAAATVSMASSVEPPSRRGRLLIPVAVAAIIAAVAFGVALPTTSGGHGEGTRPPTAAAESVEAPPSMDTSPGPSSESSGGQDTASGGGGQDDLLDVEAMVPADEPGFAQMISNLRMGTLDVYWQRGAAVPGELTDMDGQTIQGILVRVHADTALSEADVLAAGARVYEWARDHGDVIASIEPDAQFSSLVIRIVKQESTDEELAAAADVPARIETVGRDELSQDM